MPKNRLLNNAELYENDYGSLNIQNASLKRGQNVVTVDKNTPFNVLNIDGRTLVNLLGRVGNCESVTDWNINGATIALDTTNKVYGSNGFKITSNGTYAWGGTQYYRMINILDKNKYYIFLAEAKNGNATNASISLECVGGTGTGGGTWTLPITSTTKFETLWMKVQPSNMTGATNLNLHLFANGTNGQYTYFDGLRVYEITLAEYNALGTGTLADVNKVAEKYPYVDDVKHLQNPYLIKSGRNLLPPFQEWTLNSYTINDSYSVSITPTVDYMFAQVVVPVLPNTTYSNSYSATGTGYSREIQYQDINKTYISSSYSQTFTTPSNCYYVNYCLYNNAGVRSAISFTNPMLNLGSTALSFEPQNNDYLFLNTTLASNVDGTVKDYAYYKNGSYYKSKIFSPEIVLDGNLSLAWSYDNDYTGFKRVRTTGAFGNVKGSGSSGGYTIFTKYDGSYLNPVAAWDKKDIYQLASDGVLYMTIADVDSGWGESYTPTVGEIQAYFYGWRMRDNVSLNPYTTGTKAWGSVMTGGASYFTNTLPTTFASDYTTRYKLTYQLAQEQEELIPFEGDIQLHTGGNQIELGEGMIIREKANPYSGSDNMIRINNKFDGSGSTASSAYLKNRAISILSIYRNGLKDNSWKWYTSTTNPDNNGLVSLYTPKADYDPTAEYTVSYIVQDKYAQTSNIFSGSAVYNTNIRNIVNQISQELTDVTTAEKALELRFQNYGIKGLGERIEYGTVGMGDLVNGYNAKSVSFSRSFNKPPQVFLTLVNNNATMFINASSELVTTTSFNATLASNTATGASNYVLRWVAIGT